MNRYPSVVVALFLAAGCEHSGSVEAPPTPRPAAATAPAPAPPPDTAEVAPGASVAPETVPVLTDAMRGRTADYPLTGRGGPYWGGKEKPRIKAKPVAPVAAPAPEEPAQPVEAPEK